MNRLLEYIALPSEGLSWFRRGLALLCVLDSVLRLGSASFFLSDLGVLPRSLYYSFFERSYAWSVYLISGRPEVSMLLLVCTVALGLWHISGRSTRLTRITLWVLLLSVQNRHPGVLDSSDDLLRLMLFWDIFLPTDAPDPPSDAVSPATVGLQIQLTLVLVLTASSLSPDSLSLTSQWAGSLRAEDLAWFATLERSSLWLLALAVWCGRARWPLLVLALPAMILRAVFLHPVLPLTLALALLCLVRVPRRQVSLSVNGFARTGGLKSDPRLMVVFVSLMSILTLGLNFVTHATFRAPLVALGQGLGFLQDWERHYPLASESFVELVARQPENQRVLWTVTTQSNRRERLLAQRVAGQVAWSGRMSKAIGDHFGNGTGNAVLWMRVEELRPDFRLSGSEVQLLSTTPGPAMTRRRVTP
jgi:hypothetical protein